MRLSIQMVWTLMIFTVALVCMTQRSLTPKRMTAFVGTDGSALLLEGFQMN